MLLRQRAQQHHRVHGHLFYIDRLRDDLDIVVEPREVKQLLGRALEALGLVADVGDELAHGLGVHVLVLHDAVREQTYRCKRRLELVRSVGDKAAALVLGIVKALGKGVEFAPELAELVRAGYREPVLIVPAGDDAHGIGKVVQSLEDDRGIYHGHHERREGDYEGDGAYLHLEVVYDAAALGVRLMQVHRPCDGALTADGDGVAAGESFILL